MRSNQKRSVYSTKSQYNKLPGTFQKHMGFWQWHAHLHTADHSPGAGGQPACVPASWGPVSPMPAMGPWYWSSPWIAFSLHGSEKDSNLSVGTGALWEQPARCREQAPPGQSQGRRAGVGGVQDTAGWSELRFEGRTGMCQAWKEGLGKGFPRQRGPHVQRHRVWKKQEMQKPKAIHRLSAIPIKLPSAFSTELEQTQFLHLFLLFSHSDVSNSLQSHGLQHLRPLCPSSSPEVCPSSCPLHRWKHKRPRIAKPNPEKEKWSWRNQAP